MGNFAVNSVLSVIIPFRERSADPDSIRRLDTAIACFAGVPNIEVVVCDSGQQSTDFKLTGRKQENLRYYHQCQPGVFAPGRVRNAAVERATGRYIFLFDADLLISRKMVQQLSDFVRELASEGPQAFRMFPCLYLSQSCSAHFAANFLKRTLQAALYRDVLESYLRGEVSKVDGIALASSCLLINREWFMAIGGFREEFAGHGCEDFDLIHRLAAFYPVGKRPDDYSEDIKCQFPADYRGFRRYFSYYAVPHLFNGEFLLHQWHPRPLTRKYHRKRKDNEAWFSRILREPVLTLPPPMVGYQANRETLGLIKKEPFISSTRLPEFDQWLQGQLNQNGYPADKFHGFFHYQDGAKRPGGNLRQKIRKLILNPKAFFQDMMR